MTSPSGAAPANPKRATGLFGTGPDLLLGCGLGYAIVVVAQLVLGEARLAVWAPAGILVMIAAIPHYGGTLLRVYETRADRRKYAFFSVYASVIIGLLLVFGLRYAWLGSLVLTVYLTWSPWHYTGQNYGVALMVLGRRGARVSPAAKRWLYASFLTSYVMTFCGIHAAAETATYAPVTYRGTAFHMLPIGIPEGLLAVLQPLLLAAYLVSTGVAAGLLRRNASWRVLAPGAALVLTQSLWFAVPVVMRHFAWATDSQLFTNVYTAYGFIWIATFHAVQYLWVTTYYARASGREPRVLPYLGKAALAGYAIWTLPALVFAPGLLGDLPYESGLALMVAAVVNLHHFVLDGAIWKLRDTGIGRVLLRSEPPEPEPLAESGVSWRRRLALAAGAVALAVAVGAAYEGYMGNQRALGRGDLERARTAAKRLAWLGRDGPAIHTELARQWMRRSDLDRAEAEFRKSLALYPTAAAWFGLGELYAKRRDWSRALEAYDEALALQSGHAGALYRSGLVLLEQGRPSEAIPRLERAQAAAPSQAVIGLSLQKARTRAAAASPSAATE
ncbi:MAG: tetratricopeptide repeat protein [Proteobacteria bacterium]|nr:tetratricopeptide repeat protein [Pseudomonadota bacterium]